MDRTKVIVFGVFDGLHAGHYAFLRQAGKYGDLYVVVAPDSAVLDIKGHMPIEGQNKRLEAVKNTPYVCHASLGDDLPGIYSVISEVEPRIIAFGYDQDALAENLEQWLKKHDRMDIELVRLKPYKPEVYKSSKIIKHKISRKANKRDK